MPRVALPCHRFLITLTTAAATAATLAACGEPPQTQAEQPAEVRTAALLGSDIRTPGAVAQRNGFMTPALFRPHSLTPDGRLGLVLSGPDVDRPSAFQFVALADPAITADPAFTGTQAHSALFPATPFTIDRIPLGAGETVEGGVDGVTRTIDAATPLRAWPNAGSSTLALDPRFAPSGKPIPLVDPRVCATMKLSDRDAFVDPAGRYECYRLIHLLPFYANVGDGTVWALHQAMFAVVVDARGPETRTGVAPRAGNPRIVSATYLPVDGISGYRLSTNPERSRALHSLEATSTGDGRLLTAASGLWALNETPWKPDGWSFQRNFAELYAHAGDQICRRIDPATGERSCAAGQTESFGRVYPVAAQPLHYADGYPWPAGHCSYTWISPEGTDIFCRLTHEAGDGLVLPASTENLTGISFFAVGQHTGWMWRRLDGGINARRFNPDQLQCATPPGCPKHLNVRPLSPMFLNTSTGFWAQNRGAADTALPVLRQWPLFQFVTLDNSLFSRGDALIAAGLMQPGQKPVLDGTPAFEAKSFRYWEASFACGANPRCLLHLPMNELAYDTTAGPAVLRAVPVTEDTSNNVVVADAAGTPIARWLTYFGALSGVGARFIGDLNGSSASPPGDPRDDDWYLSGFRGTGISLTAAGSVGVWRRAVDVAGAPCGRSKGCLADEEYTDGFTAELAVLPLFGLTTSTSLPLAEHHGLWSVKIVNGQLRVAVDYTLPGNVRTGTVVDVIRPLSSSTVNDTPAAQSAAWTYVTVRVSKAEGTLAVYVNGASQALVNLPSGAVLKATGSPSGELVRVGPAGTCAGCPGGDILFVDELRFHNAPLRPEEIVAAAGAVVARPPFLPAADARVLVAEAFRASNPRKLTLAPDGFPAFVKAEDLRVPSVFGAYVSTPGKFAKVVAAGQTLFSSPVLSTNSQGQSQAQSGSPALMSCAACHDPARAFTDGRVTAVGVRPNALNTPTIVNRGLATSQFFAQRSRDLLDQALRPVVNPDEMNADLARVRTRINQGTDADARAARAALQAAFGTGVTFADAHLQQALTAFELVQLSADSLAEAVLAGGKPLSDGRGSYLRPDVVRQGKELFEGKARCSACHTGPNLSDELAHNTGVADRQRRAFKTPTLWDVASTGPYFHDGSKATLRDVLDFYNRGGDGLVSASDRTVVQSIDPELRPLALTPPELSALEVYLLALRNIGPTLASSPYTPALTFSEHGAIPGLTCVSVNPGGGAWADNYLCSPTDIGLAFSASGPIAGKTCTRITEANGPALFNNAYVCVPPSSTLALAWSEHGPIAGKACTKFLESPEDTGWDDNHLCWNEPLRLFFSVAGPIAGLACTPMVETADPNGWNDNQLCANKDIGLAWRSAGSIGGMRCTLINEPAEPAAHTWADNYLCVPSASTVRLEFATTATAAAGKTCVSLAEGLDPHGWADNALCYRE